MPRIADHDARRAQIRQGVRAAAQSVGLRSVTMARAARAAGVSVGMVQHYYESKEALFVDTLENVLDGVMARVDRATAAAEAEHARIEHMLGAAIEQLLPLGRRRREEAYLRMAFLALALDHEALRGDQRRFAEGLELRAVSAIRNAMGCGEIPHPSAVDPEIEARALLALVDGLCGQMLIDATAHREQDARRVVAARMRTLFPGECSHHVPPLSV